ncbi:MAG: hypothetical protein ACF8OB_15280 [Phycisphaeraceae bacterium JB051]
MFETFPRYLEHDPAVPVWCLTPDRGGAIHRFFDTSPISPSGRYLAIFRMPFEDRLPEAGEKGDVCVVDLQTGEDRIVAQTCGWETQLGANINWGDTDHALYFNDVDTQTWKPFAWQLDPITGERKPMQGTVYHASPDGRYLISANMRTMRRTQPGYGVCIPTDMMQHFVGPTKEDGFYITDTLTGESRILATIHDLFFCANPGMSLEQANGYEIYGFHSKFNAQSDRLMLSLRWYPKRRADQWNMFEDDFKAVDYAWLTIKPDGSDMHCAVGPAYWKRSGHHATWFPDGQNISMNLQMQDQGMMALVRAKYDGTGIREMHETIPGSGHPTVVPGERYVLSDTYIYESIAFGDGSVPLRWIDLQQGTESCAVRIHSQTPQQQTIGALRVDPHPAWDRTGRYVVFNGFVNGTRRVFVADFQNLLP